jgi:hypothetical protein
MDSTFLSSGHTKDEWLKNSYMTEFPDAIFRTHTLITHFDCGDMLLCCKEDYDLGQDYEILVKNYKGGHGGLRKRMMSVPYMITGPDIKPTVISTLRSEELGDTIFNLLGIENVNQ